MLQEVCEPLKRVRISADPEKVHFLDCQVTITLVVAIPDTNRKSVKSLEDGWTDGPTNKQKGNILFLRHNAYQTDFRMDANGVTPIPAPIHIMTLYLNTSCKKKTLNLEVVLIIAQPNSQRNQYLLKQE